MSEETCCAAWFVSKGLYSCTVTWCEEEERFIVWKVALRCLDKVARDNPASKELNPWDMIVGGGAG